MRTVVRWVREMSDHELQVRMDTIVMAFMFGDGEAGRPDQERVLIAEFKRRVVDHASGILCTCESCVVALAAGPSPF